MSISAGYLGRYEPFAKIMIDRRLCGLHHNDDRIRLTIPFAFTEMSQENLMFSLCLGIDTLSFTLHSSLYHLVEQTVAYTQLDIKCSDESTSI